MDDSLPVGPAQKRMIEQKRESAKMKAKWLNMARESLLGHISETIAVWANRLFQVESQGRYQESCGVAESKQNKSQFVAACIACMFHGKARDGAASPHSRHKSPSETSEEDCIERGRFKKFHDCTTWSK